MDWSQGLDKQASAQGIWLYCAGAAIDLCNDLGTDAPRDLREHIERRRRAMLDRLYDTDSGLFISGPDRQVSWASQVWAVLAGVLPEEEAAGCLDRVARMGDAVGMVTPYMMHHYIEALCLVGRRVAAHEALRRYWGDMVKLGADTFWELFDPENPNESPYGSPVVNSYCHAWSCTPTWFLRTW